MKVHPIWNGERDPARVKNKIKQALKRGERYQGELNKEESLLLNLMQVTLSQISLLYSVSNIENNLKLSRFI